MLAAAITSGRITERAMGGLSEVTATVRCVWVATSNNASLDADAVSRTVVIRLDTKMENPEGRRYKSNPLTFISENRAQVAGALLTLIRKWQADGSPIYSGPHQSRFTEWQSVIGGILQSAGIEGFLDNLSSYRSTLDPEKAAWCEFVQAWHKAHGNKYVTAKHLLPQAFENPELAAVLGDRESIYSKILGKQLSVRRDKIFGGFKIQAADSSSNKGIQYRLVSP
jgi:hypothetical protein